MLRPYMNACITYMARGLCLVFHMHLSPPQCDVRDQEAA